MLRRAFIQRTGLHPAGQASLDWYNARIHAEVVAANSEEWWSGRNDIHYESARQQFAKWHIQVVYAKSADFIIGDSPVITTKTGDPGVSVDQGVALGDATMICMPVSPKILIGIGPAPAQGEFDDAEVLECNAFQLRGFVRWLAAKPGGVSDEHMRTHIPARTILNGPW
jgi:hypothetical protein